MAAVTRSSPNDHDQGVWLEIRMHGDEVAALRRKRILFNPHWAGSLKLLSVNDVFLAAFGRLSQHVFRLLGSFS
jgi:hypothetical protein